MNKTLNASKKVTAVPARTEPFGGIGWTVYEFANATEAAAWVRLYPQAAMPCWKRWDVIDGELLEVR